MLALTRRAGEELVIGDPTKPMGVIRVVDIRGDKVRLSFDFPRDVKINRRELAEQKAKQGDHSDDRLPSGKGPVAEDAPGRESDEPKGDGSPDDQKP